jgi:hypothetical protein
MIALAIIALIRVFLLRGFIILSPLILLLFCLEKVGKEKVAGIDKIIGMLKNSFSLQSFLGLAFKPVIITLAISGALIVSILMKNAFKSGGDSTLEILPGTAITSIENKETINTKKETTYTTTMNTQTVNMTFKNMGKNFGEFLVTLVTLFLMAFIIKLAATSKTGIKRLDDKVGEAAKTVGRLAGNIPIIPIGANGGGISYSSVMGNDGLIDKLKTGGGTIAAWQKENETNMRKLFNIKDNKASEVEYNLLDKAIENAKNNNSINRKEFSTKTQELIAKDYEVGLGIPEWKQRASRWMEEISQNKYDSHISNTEPIYNFRRKWQTLNKIEDLNEKRKQALDDDQARNSYWKAF